MGVDWSASPVRLASDAMREIREDPQLWETASFYPPFYDDPEPIPEISRRLTADWPEGLEWRVGFLDRAYNQVEYLLDPVAYRRMEDWARRERSLSYRIVHGDNPFAEHAVSGQGFPWRCSSREFLAEAVEVIDRLDVARVRAEYSKVDMSRLGVYKVSPRGDDGISFDANLERLRQLGDFYRSVVDSDFDVVVELY
ncbi:DUF1877 family protein [Stackebrandtia nassauensis]|uniref:DUF1877 domain-containing protein n=1 Tax=Stackebrandtia nassauensis (strain DSM 44728 / CIP 108903 / NRRL B-16338 / NBRC 102104 / LLR-40K-21) TaxID=446470 RepID=D3Q7P8_STANL|nr:DUF1877 family protein [Stackebrandtia nassauensis]ADD44390.1 hypothetical protein Snas_4748 [Stackebrandtia nassauensis DSM 44728]